MMAFLVLIRLLSLLLAIDYPSASWTRTHPQVNVHRVGTSGLQYQVRIQSSCSICWFEVRHYLIDYIQPALDRLSVLHNFTIESQVQFFAPLAFEPVGLENGAFGLTQEQLSVFVNSAEWTLCEIQSAYRLICRYSYLRSIRVSNDPVLHFVIFVPSASRRPLRMLEGSGIR